MADRKRDGGERIVKLARALVVIVQTFAATLWKKYGKTSGIGLLISAILALAELLPTAESDVLDYGGDNDDILLDPATAPGVDPSAPPTGDPPSAE